MHPPSPLCLFQNVCKPAEELRRPPTLQEIKQQIASYNSREKNCLGMKLVSGPAHPCPQASPHALPVSLLCSPSGFWGSPLDVPFLLASGGLRGCGRPTAWAARALSFREIEWALESDTDPISGSSTCSLVTLGDFLNFSEFYGKREIQ